MNNIYQTNFSRFTPEGTFEPLVGSVIDSVIAEAWTIAQAVSTEDLPECRQLRELTGQLEGDFVVTFEHNDVLVKVSKDTDTRALLRDWERGTNGYLGESPVVGPNPKPELSDEEKASDAAIKLQKDAEREREAIRWQQEARAHFERVTARMADAPEMEFAGEEGRAFWQSLVDANKGDLGMGVLNYAERWARMMQMEMAAGKSLAGIYRETSLEADLEGVSGFSSGFGERALIQSWKYGSELAQVRKAAKEAWGRGMPFPGTKQIAEGTKQVSGDE